MIKAWPLILIFFLATILTINKRNYINNFAILFKHVIKSIFEFVNRYFFIQVIDINCIIRTRLTIFVFYRLACITYLDRQNSIQTFSIDILEFNFYALYFTTNTNYFEDIHSYKLYINLMFFVKFWAWKRMNLWILCEVWNYKAKN